MADLEHYRNLYRLDGRVVLVAGGAGGIGTAICEAVAAHGATVVVAGRSTARVNGVAAAITDAGGSAHGLELDPVAIDTVDGIVAGLAERLGGVDVLVNCVGTHIEAPAEEYSAVDWDHIFDVNLRAAFFLSRAVAKVQIPAGGGKHVHLSSVRSAIGLRRGYVSYCASKGGLNLMVKQLATEWGKYNITVNGIAPTFTRTDLVKHYLEDPAFYDPLIARIPLGRICEPEDVAALAVYFAAPASDFVTGQIVYQDGGITASQ